jgi:hypothetical protein
MRRLSGHWAESPEYQEIAKDRRAGADTVVLLVKGLTGVASASASAFDIIIDEAAGCGRLPRAVSDSSIAMSHGRCGRHRHPRTAAPSAASRLVPCRGSGARPGRGIGLRGCRRADTTVDCCACTIWPPTTASRYAPNHGTITTARGLRAHHSQAILCPITTSRLTISLRFTVAKAVPHRTQSPITLFRKRSHAFLVHGLSS